jgi:hypothetical protein
VHINSSRLHELVGAPRNENCHTQLNQGNNPRMNKTDHMAGKLPTKRFQPFLRMQHASSKTQLEFLIVFLLYVEMVISSHYFRIYGHLKPVFQNQTTLGFFGGSGSLLGHGIMDYLR